MCKWSSQSRSIAVNQTLCWSHGNWWMIGSNVSKLLQSTKARTILSHWSSDSTSSFFARQPSREKLTSASTTRFWTKLPVRSGKSKAFDSQIASSIHYLSLRWWSRMIISCTSACKISVVLFHLISGFLLSLTILVPRWIHSTNPKPYILGHTISRHKPCFSWISLWEYLSRQRDLSLAPQDLNARPIHEDLQVDPFIRVRW